MSCETGDCHHDWHYAHPGRSLKGALQHGLGRGAELAVRDPDGPELVMARLERDERWDSGVDERAVYLARLVRDLRLEIGPIVERLFTAPPEDTDDDNVFALTLEVLEVLGAARISGVVDGVRRYVREGPRWMDVLATIARSWPAEWWGDLRPVAHDRIAESGEEQSIEQILWRSPPWTHWAEQDEVIAAWARSRDGHRPARPFAGKPATELLALLRSSEDKEARRYAVRELRHHPPQPEILDIIDERPSDGLFLGRLVEKLGAQALPAARRWARMEENRHRWTAYLVLAAHGVDCDAPLLIEALDWLDACKGDRCGYDSLAKGLARIGGPVATAAVPRLRQLWFSPHSYERAAYLRALIALDPGGVSRLLLEGLWDCEADVRLLAAEQVELTDRSRRRLYYLSNDPIETAEVRAAAHARLLSA